MKKDNLIKQQKIVNEDTQKVKSFIIATIVVLLVIGLVYFLNGKFVTKDLFQKDTTTTTEATYDKTLLLVDSIFSVKDKEYYVLAYDTKDDKTANVYSSLITAYQNDKINLYSIDLANQMNKKYYDVNKSESIKKDNFNFTKATLLVIKDGKISSTITNMEKIINKLA